MAGTAVFSAGGACPHCADGRLYFEGGVAGAPSRLACFACGWRPEAARTGRLPSREAFWLAAEARGVSRAQFDQEWDEYQRSKLTKVNQS